MTTITITKDAGDNYKGFECSGHAGFARSGEDIVCAAVSVLTINTINSIEKLTDDKFDSFQDDREGILGLNFRNTPSEQADLLMRSFELGVTGIYKQYGKKFLNIKFRRE